MVVFIHWGAEWTNTANSYEENLTSQLADCGVSAIIGHHSHQASATVQAINGGAADSCAITPEPNSEDIAKAPHVAVDNAARLTKPIYFR